MQERLPDVNVADGVGNEEIVELVLNGEIAMEMIWLTRVVKSSFVSVVIKAKGGRAYILRWAIQSL
jgi:hypothetical protein